MMTIKRSEFFFVDRRYFFYVFVYYLRYLGGIVFYCFSKMSRMARRYQGVRAGQMFNILKDRERNTQPEATISSNSGKLLDYLPT